MGGIFGIAVIVLAVGCFLGWHASRAHAAHGDIKTVRRRIPGYRKTRLRSGLIAVGLIITSLVIVHDLINH
ncbi:MAG TPA: hypothetical protein VH637_01910 [Streptosporangiaceae bacterium]|jgi:hypothetical protein